MDKHLFNLKFTAKTLQRQAKKSQKDEAAEKAKLKKAIQQGNMEGARIYASNAIRKKNEALNLLRLGSRIDGVAARVQTAVTMRKVSQSMAGVVKGMEKAMSSMNLEQISMVMDKFESQFEDLDVQTQYMESSMGQTTAMSTPQDQVEDLMQQVAEENGLELQMEMPGAATGTLNAAAGTATVEKDQDDLTERLAKLRNVEPDALGAEQPSCGGGSSEPKDAYTIGTHIAGLFTILAVSATGILTTIVISTTASLKSRQGVLTALHLVKFFGIGVIAATAWIHLLPDAFENFTNPCLEGYWNVYGGRNYVGLFALVAGFLVQGIEMLSVKHNDHDSAAVIADDHEKLPTTRSTTSDGPPPSVTNNDTTLSLASIATHGHQGHNQHQSLSPLSTLILEAGIIFHSLIIGLTLGTTPDAQFGSLLTAIAFHQFAEGAALGVLLSAVVQPKTFSVAKLYAAGILYPLTTPIGIAIGIAIRDTYDANSQASILIQGILDSLSAGILIYNAYCELISKEINQSGQFRGLSRGIKFASMMCLAAVYKGASRQKSSAPSPTTTTDPAVKDPTPSTVEAAMRDFSAKAAEKNGSNSPDGEERAKKPEDIAVNGNQTIKGASFKPKTE
ncbi:Charged multivesicular body protein 1a [Geranomyces michiganensis]|nr:Charged multivesicular body protein 1a [Geranomyces michiganensis]